MYSFWTKNRQIISWVHVCSWAFHTRRRPQEHTGRAGGDGPLIDNDLLIAFKSEAGAALSIFAN